MDYMFYGKVGVEKPQGAPPDMDQSTVSLVISADPDEKVTVYHLLPLAEEDARLQPMELTVTEVSVKCRFTVSDNEPFHFVIEAMSNESHIPCVGTYVVAKGAVLVLPGDDESIEIEGATTLL